MMGATTVSATKKQRFKVRDITEKYHNFKEELNENKNNKRYLVCYSFELFANVVECIKNKRDNMDIFYGSQRLVYKGGV